MNILLNRESQAFVDEKVRKGDYASAEDVINSALLALQTEEELSAPEAQALREEIQIGVTEADQGELELWDPAEIATEVERRWGLEHRTA